MITTKQIFVSDKIYNANPCCPHDILDATLKFRVLSRATQAFGADAADSVPRHSILGSDTAICQ